MDYDDEEKRSQNVALKNASVNVEWLGVLSNNFKDSFRVGIQILDCLIISFGMP